MHCRWRPAMNNSQMSICKALSVLHMQAQSRYCPECNDLLIETVFVRCTAHGKQIFLGVAGSICDASEISDTGVKAGPYHSADAA